MLKKYDVKQKNVDLFKKIFGFLFIFIDRYPKFRVLLVNLACKIKLERPLRSLYARLRPFKTMYSHDVSVYTLKEMRGLSPRAKKIYQDLKQAIEEHKGKN